MGGSGGGASGAVTYPAYLTTFHQRLLDHSGSDEPDNSFITAYDTAYGNSPFASAVAYDPAAELALAQVGVTRFSSTIDELDHIPNFTEVLPVARTSFPLGTSPIDVAGLYTTELDTVTVSGDDIASDIAAMDAILTDQIEQEELPRFRAGMLNINAIHSSAYIIGEALIRASKDRILAKYATDLQLKTSEQVREINARHALSYRDITARLQINASEIEARHKLSNREISAKFYIHREELVRVATVGMLADLMKKVEFNYQLAHINAEVRRMGIVGRKEQIEEQLAIDESDAKWDLELFRYAGLLMAGPSGGVAQGNDKKSKAVSAIGGAVSGAATGAMAGAMVGGVGAPFGAAIGAVAGVGLALLS